MPSILFETLLLVGLVQQAGATLEGCLLVSRLGVQLSSIRHSWATLRPEQLAKTWHAQLAPESCERDTGKCLMLVSRSRVIAGQPECTETFLFSADDGRLESFALDSVIVNYTLSRYRDTAGVAKQLSRALMPAGRGAPPADSYLGSESAPLSGHYQWEEGPWLWALDFSLHPQTPRWRMYLSIGRYRK